LIKEVESLKDENTRLTKLSSERDEKLKKLDEEVKKCNVVSNQMQTSIDQRRKRPAHVIDVNGVEYNLLGQTFILSFIGFLLMVYYFK